MHQKTVTTDNSPKNGEFCKKDLVISPSWNEYSFPLMLLSLGLGLKFNSLKKRGVLRRG